jgi:predicted HTH transcriptional regulator
MAKVHSKELSKLLDHGEDYTLDYKESDKLVDPGRENRKDIARHLVGLANRDGGQLVFGVEDESRKPDGTNIRREEAEGTLSEMVEDW